MIRVLYRVRKVRDVVFLGVTEACWLVIVLEWVSVVFEIFCFSLV